VFLINIRNRVISHLSFGRGLFLVRNSPAWTLARPRVGAGTLAIDGEVLAVPDSPVTADVHEPLDVHADRRTKHAFRLKLGDHAPDLIKLILGKVLDLFMAIDIGLRENGERGRSADPREYRSARFPPVCCSVFQHLLHEPRTTSCNFVFLIADCGL
jgi:hypothetical protein